MCDLSVENSCWLMFLRHAIYAGLRLMFLRHAIYAGLRRTCASLCLSRHCTCPLQRDATHRCSLRVLVIAHVPDSLMHLRQLHAGWQGKTSSSNSTSGYVHKDDVSTMLPPSLLQC